MSSEIIGFGKIDEDKIKVAHSELPEGYEYSGRYQIIDGELIPICYSILKTESIDFDKKIWYNIYRE